jgi:hypothetical protein
MDKKEKQRYDCDYLQQYCQKNHIELLEDYTNLKINRETVIKAKCLTEGCENDVLKKLRNILLYGCYCKNHLNKFSDEKRKLTCLNKYGVEHSFQSENNKEKTKNTMLNKYGVEHVSKVKEIQDKIKFKNKDKYGVEFPLQSKAIRQKAINTMLSNYGVEYAWQSNDLKDKMQNTLVKKFGVKHITQNHNIKEQIKQTNLEKYGTKCPLQNDEIKEKSKSTNLEKYGVEYPIKTQQVREKIKTTNLEKYGVEYPAQNQEVAEKQSKTAYKSKDFIFPSGRIERIQGYEHFMLNELLEKENISEDDIIVNRGEVPSVWYEDKTGKKRRYFVDCYIKSQNRCVEAKSTWTANKKKDCIFLKQKALQDAGYICEIWIYNQKGEKVECYK